MNIDELFAQSLQLLGLGMGSVFVILILLIGIISTISKLVPEEKFVDPSTKSPAPAVNTQHIGAIQAAIHKFRNR
ncbi:MAG: sodium pump decarboxylase gamma subunit [Polaribacter sp.]|jgi:sodium pump decarboxylase gamma subunit